jgi:hypothetical protein
MPVERVLRLLIRIHNNALHNKRVSQLRYIHSSSSSSSGTIEEGGAAAAGKVLCRPLLLLLPLSWTTNAD